MKVDTLKIIWWLVLIVSAQTWTALLLGLALVSINGQSTTMITAAPVHIVIASIALTGVALRNVSAYNRIQPPDWRGHWQFSLSDLVVIMFFGGAVMSLLKLIHEKAFSSGSVLTALYLTGEFAIAMIFAARIGGYSAAKDRSVMAFCMMLGAFVLTLGTWGTVAVFVLFFMRAVR